MEDNSTIKEKINEEILCVLKRNDKDSVEIGYVDINNPFKSIIEEFVALCDNPETSIQQIINFIQNTEEFEQLTAYYRYCVSLGSAYQAFSANNQETIKDINQRYDLILFNKKENPEKYDSENAVKHLKSEIKNKYILWSKAYAINKTYRICHEDKNILTFSHRIDGWSNPVYQLTPNFSVEIKTNFGYGSVSYFYTKLKYKNIDITPFSEWIDYEFARFSDIIRYTQSYNLKNEHWLEAMEFSRDACNLSLTDEMKFVEKYVIDECEKMVSGLENLFNKEQFTFKDWWTNNKYTRDKKGHILIEFRGEKISGALDFISKILELEKIATIKSFIERIENCNKSIQPILVEEAKILKLKIENLNQERDKLQPQYDEVVKIYANYTAKKAELQAEMVSKEQLNPNWIDTNKLETEFAIRFPEYPEFKKEYNIVTEKYRILTEQIQNNTKVRDNIVSYNEKITKYFG